MNKPAGFTLNSLTHRFLYKAFVKELQPFRSSLDASSAILHSNAL